MSNDYETSPESRRQHREIERAEHALTCIGERLNAGKFKGAAFDTSEPAEQSGDGCEANIILYVPLRGLEAGNEDQHLDQLSAALKAIAREIDRLVDAGARLGLPAGLRPESATDCLKGILIDGARGLVEQARKGGAA